MTIAEDAPRAGAPPRPASRRRRVALVTSGLGPPFGGIGVVTQSIADALAPIVDLTLWRHHHTWHRAFRAAALGARAFVGALGRPDFVFYEHVDLAQIHRGVPGLKSTPYGVFLHGTELWRPLNEPRRAALEGAAVRTVNSATTVRWARDANPWFPDARVTWLGVRPDPLVERVGPRPPTAAIVGRIVAGECYKGHDEILDAWPEVRRAVPDAKVIVAGTGNDLERLRSRVEREGIEGVEFTGWVTNERRSEIYRSSRLLLFPSRGEGFGLVAAEAAAAGAGVLALRNTVLEELYPDGMGSVLLEKASGPELAAAVIPVLADSAHAVALGQAARDRTHSEFLEDRFQARFLDAVGPFVGL